MSCPVYTCTICPVWIPTTAQSTYIQPTLHIILTTLYSERVHTTVVACNPILILPKVLMNSNNSKQSLSSEILCISGTWCLQSSDKSSLLFCLQGLLCLQPYLHLLSSVTIILTKTGSFPSPSLETELKCNSKMYSKKYAMDKSFIPCNNEYDNLTKPVFMNNCEYLILPVYTSIP